MSRKIVALAFAAAGKAEMAAGWARLGFSPEKGAIALADGVTLDFAGHDDPGAEVAGGATLLGLSGDADAHLTARPQSFEGMACMFALAAARKSGGAAHPNGALSLKRIAAVADDPADYAEILSKITGRREMLATSAGLEIGLDGARLDVLTPAAFAFRYGSAPAAGLGFRVAGVSFGVADPGKTENYLQSQGVGTRSAPGGLVVAPGEMRGVEKCGVLVGFERE